MAVSVKTFDLALYLIPLIFVVTSVAVIYSLVFGTGSIDLSIRQGVFGIIGLLLMTFAGFVDYRTFKIGGWFLYGLSIILLILTELFGKTINGAQNWLDLGFVQIQPSEVAKMSVILVLSSYFASRMEKIKLADILTSVLIIAPPLILILKEPDLGTAMIVFVIYLALFFAAKPSKIYLWSVSALMAATILVFLLSAYKVSPFSSVLKDYQRNRILNFISPSRDPYGSGYNVRQSQIAVGSGGVFGKGLGRGSQNQLRFLPEPYTDFIFAGIAESFGFLGSTIFLLLYLYLLIRLTDAASVSQDNFGMLLSYGVAAMLFFQVIINVGMNLGVAPVTGIPLPLLSSGGTALITTLFLIGLVQSVFIRHKKISF